MYWDCISGATSCAQHHVLQAGRPSENAWFGALYFILVLYFSKTLHDLEMHPPWRALRAYGSQEPYSYWWGFVFFSVDK